jgi:hypothetical protein
MENTQNTSNFLRMQKLAGVITEEEHRIKLKEIIDQELNIFLNKFKSKNIEFANILKNRGYV